MSRIQKGSSSTIYLLGIKWQSNVSRYFGDMLQTNKFPKFTWWGRPRFPHGVNFPPVRACSLKALSLLAASLTRLTPQCHQPGGPQSILGIVKSFTSRRTLAENLSLDTALGEGSGISGFCQSGSIATETSICAVGDEGERSWPPGRSRLEWQLQVQLSLEIYCQLPKFTLSSTGQKLNKSVRWGWGGGW